MNETMLLAEVSSIVVNEDVIQKEVKHIYEVILMTLLLRLFALTSS
jgi:hypothetical protein